MQHTATHCNTPQHTATHCSTHSKKCTYICMYYSLSGMHIHCSVLQHRDARVETQRCKMLCISRQPCMERCRPRDGEMQAQRCRDAGAEMWRCKSLCILYICLYIYITYIYIYTYRKEEGKKECAAPGLSRNKKGQETKKGEGGKKKGEKGKLLLLFESLHRPIRISRVAAPALTRET